MKSHASFENKNAASKTGNNTPVFNSSIPDQPTVDPELNHILFDQSADLIFCLDLQYRLTKINSAFVHFTGLSYSDLIGNTFKQLGFQKNNSMEWDQVLHTIIKTNESLFAIDIPFLFAEKLYYFKTNLHPLHHSDRSIIGFAVIVNEINENNETRAALENSRKELFTMLDRAPDFIVIHTAGKIEFINKQGIKLLGAVSKDHFLGKEMLDFVHPDYRHLVKERVLHIDTDKDYVSYLEEKFIKLDGSFIDVEVRAIAVMFQQKQSVLIMARDISLRKKVYETIEMERKLFRTVIDIIPDPVYVKDLEGKKLIANKRDLEYMGYTSEDEARGKSDQEIYGPRVEAFSDVDKSVIQEGKSVISKEEFVTSKNGEHHWVLTSKVPLRNQQNEIIGLVGIGRDISERKKYLDKLFESQERLQKIISSSYDCIWQFDEQLKYTYISENVHLLSGYTANEIIGKLPMDFMMPEEATRLSNILRETLQNRENIIDLENWNVHKNGHQICLLTNGTAYYDKNGKYCGYIGVTKDITERKKEETRLNLLQSAIDNASDSIIIVEINQHDIRQSKVIYVNASSYYMTGYSQQEFIGRTPRFLTDNPENDNFLQGVNEALRSGKPYVMEMLDHRKSGESFWATFSITPVANSKGVFTHWIGIKRDINDQKKHNQDISRAIVEAQENEKYFIGSELHDNVLQILVGALFSAGMIRNLSEKEQKYLNETRKYIQESISEIRNLSHQLVPAGFKEHSVQQLFQILLNQCNIENQYIIDLHVDEQVAGLLKPDLRLNLYRILQEQMQNIMKHAQATEIEISLTNINECIQMTIRDNGIGFDLKSIQNHGIGLSNIKNRAEMFHGFMTIQSQPGAGCILQIEIPAEENH